MCPKPVVLADPPEDVDHDPVAGKSVHGDPEALVGKKTPLLAAYAAQGRGPNLAFGSRLGDERAWRCGLVIAPYLLVA